MKPALSANAAIGQTDKRPSKRLSFALALLALLSGCASRSIPPPERLPTLPVDPMAECQSVGDAAFPRLKFPSVAREAKQDGWVILQHDVVDGRVVNVRVVASSPKGMLFEESAITWAESSYFPSRKDGTRCRRQVLFQNK